MSPHHAGHGSSWRGNSPHGGPDDTPDHAGVPVRGGPFNPVVIDLGDPDAALAERTHAHSTTGVCVKNCYGPLCSPSEEGV